MLFWGDLLGYFVRDGKLIINPDEVETVKLIFHKFLIEGKGTHVIARELEEIKSALNAKHWSTQLYFVFLK